MRIRWFVRTVAVLSVAGMVAAACSSKTPVVTQSSAATGTPNIGGKLVLAEEQWPECLNPVNQCASASVLGYVSTENVMPRAMLWGLDGKPVASPLLTETPSLDNGDLTANPFTIHYKINPAAVWSDGTAITCDDFAFTRNAIINTKGTYGTAGYTPAPGLAGITNIDCTDEHTAVLQFSAAYTDWPDLFGGGSGGFILEKAAFPKENASDKVDLGSEMVDTIPFSGGPWKMEQFTQQQAVLVPNDKYWVKHNGHVTYFDQVTIVPRTDQSAELADFLSGAIGGIYPQPDVALVAQFKKDANVQYRGDPGNFYESLWFNLSKPPFDDPVVRQAMYWATDRDKVLQNIITPLDPTQKSPLGCGIFSFPGGYWCDKTPFAQYHYDVNMVSQIMTAGGYAKDSKGFWAKNGTEVSFVYKTTQKPRRIATQALLKEEMVAAGFNVTTQALDATLLFETQLPRGNFQIADFAEGGTPDPSPTGTFGCDFIPTAANSYSGANDFHWCDKAADALMKQSDSELDPAKRRDLLDQVYALEAQDYAPGIPLYVLPNLTAWRKDKVAGPVGKWNPTVYGGFFNMDEWYCPTAGGCG